MDHLQYIHNKARTDGIPIMKDDGILFLIHLLKENVSIQKILEIGTAVGYSAIRMASIREDIVIDTVEIDEKLAEIAKNNVLECGLADRIYVHVSDAASYLTMAVYDLIFIDAAKSQYGKYLEHYLWNAHQGTVFVFDNLCFHGIVDDNTLSANRSTIQMVHKIKAFREKLLKDERFETTWYPDVGDGIAVAVVK